MQLDAGALHSRAVEDHRLIGDTDTKSDQKTGISSDDQSDQDDQSD